MNNLRKPIQAIIQILRGNVICEGKTVPVIKRNYPLDKTPCINIDDSASTVTVKKQIYNKTINGEKKECIRIHRKTLLNIHLWCDTENQRADLSNQITTLFNMAYIDDYHFCTNYDKETCQCSTQEQECLSISNSTHLYKSIKNKCPKPIDYKYENIFTRYDLIKSKWDLQVPFSNDNINTKPPVLHNIFRLNAEYYDYIEIGGITSNNLYYKKDIQDNNG